MFIIAQTEKEIDLTEEINEKKDLLILDFPETLYNLVYKDIAFLAFIESSCRDADFVFKGDDDILLKSVLNFYNFYIILESPFLKPKKSPSKFEERNRKAPSSRR